MRLIDADLAVAKCNEDIEAVKDISQRVDGILDAIMNIHECPTVDAVEVVRCKDCKCFVSDMEWCEADDGFPTSPDAFCSWAERRDG